MIFDQLSKQSLPTDPTSGINATPTLIDSECHGQRFGIATVHIVKKPPEPFWGLNVRICNTAAEAFCKVAHEIKSLLGIGIPVNFGEIDCFLGMQCRGGSKKPIRKFLICLIEWFCPSVVARATKRLSRKGSFGRSGLVSASSSLLPSPRMTKGCCSGIQLRPIPSNQVAPLVLMLVTVRKIHANPALSARLGYSCCQPRNRAVVDVVAPGDLPHGLAFSCGAKTSSCWCGVSFGLRPNFTPRALARARPSPVRARIRSRSNSASPDSTVTISRPCDVVVSAHVSPRIGTRPSCRSWSASVFNRSRVDRASRSSRVTISTSPSERGRAPCEAAPGRSWLRSLLAEHLRLRPWSDGSPAPPRSARPSRPVHTRKSCRHCAADFRSGKAQSFQRSSFAAKFLNFATRFFFCCGKAAAGVVAKCPMTPSIYGNTRPVWQNHETNIKHELPDTQAVIWVATSIVAMTFLGPISWRCFTFYGCLGCFSTETTIAALTRACPPSVDRRVCAGVGSVVDPSSRNPTGRTPICLDDRLHGHRCAPRLRRLIHQGGGPWCLRRPRYRPC